MRGAAPLARRFNYKEGMRAPPTDPASAPRHSPAALHARVRPATGGLRTTGLGLLAVLLSTGTAEAKPHGFLGVDYLPLGRADLGWVEEGRLSGVLGNEEDGMVQGPLRMWGGLGWERHAVVGGLSAVRMKTTTWSSSPDDGAELVTETTVGGVRPAVDYRYYFLPRGPGLVSPYIGGGLNAVIPTVKSSSETWTASEESGFLAQQAEDRARIRGAGARIQGGAELLFDNGLMLGVRQGFEVQRGERVDTETARTTALLSTETALSLGFVF